MPAPTSITFACVRTGSKYGPEYVTRLRNMIGRHYSGEHRLICLTDQPKFSEPGVWWVGIEDYGLKSWWAKLVLFSNGAFRCDSRMIYFDLDTVIVGDLIPLVEWDGDFAICQNFTTAAGHPNWCKYGSCCMSFAPGWGQDVFDRFMADREGLMKRARHGDQSVIETLVPNATLLQDVMPPGFFLNKRDLYKHPHAPPPGAAIVVFGGTERPDNCHTKWARDAWY